MSVNWDEVQRVLIPIKDYEDLCRRLRESFAHSFVRDTFNFTIPELVNYTRKLLGGDTRGRFTEYASQLIRIFTELHQAAVQNVLNLKERIETREQLEVFTEQSGVSAYDIVTALKYLIYWFIPPEKYLSGLVQDDPYIRDAINGSGYGSIAQLANANPEQLYADFFRYGKTIGKNLKLGNEIENSYRIAKIIPVLLQKE
jgi:hypothetical protein